MEWIKDRFPKSKGMYAIRTLPITEIRSFNFAYFDGTGWLIPSQSGEKIAPHRGTPEWSIIDWGIDGPEDICKSNTYFRSMEWIDVKDRLPDYRQEVLFVNGFNKVSVGERFPNEEDVEIWAGSGTVYFNDSIFEEWAVCKYWMPLPEPPEENQ